MGERKRTVPLPSLVPGLVRCPCSKEPEFLPIALAHPSLTTLKQALSRIFVSLDFSAMHPLGLDLSSKSPHLKYIYISLYNPNLHSEVTRDNEQTTLIQGDNGDFQFQPRQPFGIKMCTSCESLDLVSQGYWKADKILL